MTRPSASPRPDAPAAPLVATGPWGGEPDGGAPPATRRAVTQAAATVVTSLLVAVAALMPLPYAVAAAGPTRDTLGEVDGTPLIEVDGAETFESDGSLLLTTISVAGGPGYPVFLVDVLAGWADRSRAVRPVEQYYAPTDTQQEVEARNEQLMISSQENATVAALEELGHEVPAELPVDRAVEGTGADGVVREGDVIVALDGEPVTGFGDLSRRLDEVEPGADVVLGVLRDGERYDLTVTTTPDDGGRARLGVYIDPVFDLPVDVSIAIDDIGGSSAGMMFALGIIDTLTEGDLTGGETIAGTGEVDTAGRVGPIGGIRQKMVGAVRDGATWFLAPAANCEEVVGHVPDGLRVVRVSTLGEARDAVEAIGTGDASDLPTC